MSWELLQLEGRCTQDMTGLPVWVTSRSNPILLPETLRILSRRWR